MSGINQSIAGFLVAFAVMLTPAGAQEPYSVEFTGAPPGFDEKLPLISKLKQGRRDYPTLAAIRRAAQKDAEAIRKGLESAGYYAAKVRAGAERGEAVSVVTFAIEPGPLFTINDYEILYRDEADGRPATLSEAEVEANGKADGASLRDTQNAFRAALMRRGFPAARIVTRRAVANFETGAAHAVFVFESGPRATFGAIDVDGANRTATSFVRAQRTWEDGDIFDQRKLVKFRDKLVGSGLFSQVEVDASSVADGAARIHVAVAERKPRTIGGGVSFSTAEGPGGRLFFEHRNIFGHAENFRIDMEGSQIEQSINFSLARPLPRLPGRAFAGFKFANETTDAFSARSLAASGGLAKLWLNDRLETRAAIALETSNIRADAMEERTYLLSTPLSLTWNSEDGLLDPKKGVRAFWSVTPYTGTDSFTQTEISARTRVHFGGNDRFTIAGRVHLGATFQNSLASLPRNKRFFSGGGGSVRGYGFQEAGPLDAENDPIGGRSLIEGSIETRARILKNIQIAAFVDAGSVSSSALPDFGEKFFIGYGGGVRYFTPIGPVRVDAAFPLDKRESDRAFQIFIALGQPF